MKTAIFIRDYLHLALRIGLATVISYGFTEEVWADSGNTLLLQGLSFVCSHCELKAGPPCSVAFLDASLISSCEEALEQLLEQAANGKFNPEHPSPAELRSFLLNARPNAHLAERALGLLLRTEAGRRAIVQDAYLFAGKYGKELSRLVAANSELEDVWLRIWQLPSREGVALVPELRAEILANLKGLNEQDLFADLSMFQSDNDLADLETYEKILTPKRGELASEIKNVREYLRACGNPMTSANVTQGCQIAGMAEAAQRFVSRMQLQWLVRSFENQTVSPANFVKRLSEMNFEKLRTPALHEALLKAIDAGAAQGAVGEQICKGEYFPMFRIFAANDRVLGVHWVGLLTRRADEFFRVGDYDASLRLLDESFKAMPEPVESRIAFLNTIIYSESWNDRADIQRRFRDVVRRGVPARAWYDLSEEKLVGIFAILAGLTFIWMIYYFLYKHRLALEERNALEAEMTALAEREELRMLRAFFEIEAGEGETELTKSYRRKAKETHPDLYGGDTAKFQEVQDKYQRARELLGRRGTPTS